jgi:hypothetical protein
MTTGWLVAFAVIGVLVAVASGILVARYTGARNVANGGQFIGTAPPPPLTGCLTEKPMPRRDTNTVRHSSIMLITLRGRCRLGNPGGR